MQTKKSVSSKSFIVYILGLIWTIASSLLNYEGQLSWKSILLIIIYIILGGLMAIIGNDSNLMLKIWNVLKRRDITVEEKLSQVEMIIIEAVSIWNAINEKNARIIEKKDDAPQKSE